MPFHFIAHFEPLPGKADEFRQEALRVNQPSREEPGCLAIDIFESVREPLTFAVHSVWEDEAAFDRHARLPHTVHFLEIAEKLLTRPIQGWRLRAMGGGPGAGARS